MMSLRLFVSLVLIFGLLTPGCSNSPEGATRHDAEFASRAIRMDVQAANETLAEAPAKAPSDAATAPGAAGIGSFAASQPDVYLIKNATITIECDDSRAASNTLVNSLQPSGAYISNLNEHVDGLGRRTITLQVRVPADKFDQSISSLESLGKTLNKQVSTEDVTEEYIDTESRTRNLKKTEERLIDHLNRAAQLEDILRVESELTRIREQIERMDGRLRFLTNRVSFSTISVTLQETAKAESIVPPQSFSTAKEFSEAARSLVGFLQGLWSRMIWLIVWLPVYGVVAYVVYVVIRKSRKKLNL